MVSTPFSDGPAILKIDANQGSGLEELGYSEDGVRVNATKYFLDVKGDEKGGMDGAPIDVQYLSRVYVVSFTLTKWTAASADKLEPVVAGGTTGSEGTAGTLLFTESNKIFRLLIHTTARPFNFVRAIPRFAFEINKGTKHSKLVLGFECHANASGVFFNSTTS